MFLNVARHLPNRDRASPMTSPPLILVIDDEFANHMVANAALAPVGWRVDYAEGGEAGVAIAQRRRYALILMDIQMPGLDGFATARAIRDGDGASAATPILAFTARPKTAIEDRARAAGMDGHVSKALTPEELREAAEPWRPAGMPAPAVRLAATFGEAEIATLIDRFRRHLERALAADEHAESIQADAHKLAGVAGTLGFPDVFQPWLDVSEGDMSAYPEARASARRALAQIATDRQEHPPGA